jgi:hypothetical protein
MVGVAGGGEGGRAAAATDVEDPIGGASCTPSKMMSAKGASMLS